MRLTRKGGCQAAHRLARRVSASVSTNTLRSNRRRTSAGRQTDQHQAVHLSQLAGSRASRRQEVQQKQSHGLTRVM